MITYFLLGYVKRKSKKQRRSTVVGSAKGRPSESPKSGQSRSTDVGSAKSRPSGSSKVGQRRSTVAGSAKSRPSESSPKSGQRRSTVVGSAKSSSSTKRRPTGVSDAVDRVRRSTAPGIKDTKKAKKAAIA